MTKRKNKAVKTNIPDDSLLVKYFPCDYKDSFRVRLDDDIEVSPDDVMVGLWFDMPGWVDFMFKVRNFMVKLVGLKGSGDGSAAELEKCIREGGKYRFVEVPEKNEQETVIIMRDKHLDAYMSVMVEGKDCYMNTLVHYNNRLGRVYFFFIRPFHGMVVRSVLKHSLMKNT